MQTLDEILRESSSRHKHLCPRQVLGARMALYASEALDLGLPRLDKRLLVIPETDGCTVDGLIAATGCHIGGRTLRILDFGKVAASFVDTRTESTVRVIPRREARKLAAEYAPTARNRREAMLLGYKVMPARELFNIQKVELTMHISQIMSRAGVKTICEVCGEEIINGREVMKDGVVLCNTCAGESYYHCSEAREMVTDGIRTG